MVIWVVEFSKQGYKIRNFFVVPFIFRILVRYETLITRAQGPVVVIAKEEI